MTDSTASGPLEQQPKTSTYTPDPEGLSRARWLCLILLSIAGFLALQPPAALAQYDYVKRNEREVYLPYLLKDNLSYWNPAENRLWQDENTFRFVSNLYGESRVNRRFFVDLGFEGVYPKDWVGFPEDLDGVGVREVVFIDPDTGEEDARDISLRAEIYGHGHLKKNWELAISLTTRAHLVQDLIPAEVQGRAILTHTGFAGTLPLNLGFFVGPQIKPLQVGVGGLTLGTFGLLSSSRYALTRGIATFTRWGDADTFDSAFQLKLGQVGFLAKRRLTLQGNMGLDLRHVYLARYEYNYGTLPSTLWYLDLSLEGSVLARLPARFWVDLSGRFLPYHTPDPNIVRWYRPVGPELSLAIQRKVAVFDFSAGYTFSLIPPASTEEEDYPDTGSGLIPGSEPGHMFSLTLNVRI